MARLTAQNFLGKGAGKLYIVNRHLERAQELAADVGGQAVHYKEVQSVVSDVDIIIASTGAPHYVITVPPAAALPGTTPGLAPAAHRHRRTARRRPGRDPSAGVTLYNIDDLQEVVHDNEATRQREAVAASYIVDEAVNTMIERYQYLSVRPVVLSLSQQAERTRRHFVKRARNKLPELTDDQFRVVENLSHILVRKILRAPCAHGRSSQHA